MSVEEGKFSVKGRAAKGKHGRIEKVAARLVEAKNPIVTMRFFALSSVEAVSGTGRSE
ncbi:MAG: hypothetical protein L0177_14280 [Chloroflexi bacterium]|nr:hypothetical protein [Chloroflexota bacterium]